MNALSFIATVLLLYIIYYGIIIILDVMKAKRVEAVKLQPVNVITADTFIDEEKPVEVRMDAIMQTAVSKFALSAKKPVQKNTEEEYTDSTEAQHSNLMKIETVTYAMEVSAENVASLFV